MSRYRRLPSPGWQLSCSWAAPSAPTSSSWRASAIRIAAGARLTSFPRQRWAASRRSRPLLTSWTEAGMLEAGMRRPNGCSRDGWTSRGSAISSASSFCIPPRAHSSVAGRSAPAASRRSFVRRPARISMIPRCVSSSRGCIRKARRRAVLGRACCPRTGGRRADVQSPQGRLPPIRAGHLQSSRLARFHTDDTGSEPWQFDRERWLGKEKEGACSLGKARFVHRAGALSRDRVARSTRVARESIDYRSNATCSVRAHDERALYESLAALNYFGGSRYVQGRIMACRVLPPHRFNPGA
jgi:hypothetical protein